MSSKIQLPTLAEIQEEANSQNRLKDISLDQIASRVQAAIPQLKVRAEFLEALDRNGASQEDIARCIGEVLNEGQTHGIRLRAAEVAMRSIGLFDTVGNQQTAVSFNIHGENVNLQAVLQPNREK